MQIRIKSYANYQEWVENLEDYNYSLFITPAWIESMIEIDRKPIYLDFISEGEVVAKVSGIALDSNFTFRKQLIFYAGPALAKNMPQHTIDRCIDEMVSYTRKNHFCRLKILSYDYRHVSNHKNAIIFSHRFEYIVDLEKDMDVIRNRISKEVFRRYRKALGNGFTVKESDATDWIDTLVRLMEDTKKIRKSKGYKDYNYFYIPLFERRQMEKLVRKNAMKFIYVEKDARVYGAQAIFYYKNKAYMVNVGFSSDAYKEGIPSFIDYYMILLLKERSFKYLNFGGIPTDKTHQGLVDFKQSIGCIPQFSTYGSSNFLLFPYNLLNPIVMQIRKLQDLKFINYLKKMLRL